MQIRRTVTIIFQGLTVILVLVLLFVFFYPDAKRDGNTVIQMLEAPKGRAPANQTEQQPTSYADAVARAAPAVVNIYTTKIVTERNRPAFEDPLYRYFFGEGSNVPQPRREPSLGSGVIVSQQGNILTNHHVIEGADEIAIALNDGRHTTAKIVGDDPESDLAVLKIDLPNLPVITLGRSEDLRVGDVVLAIGNPFGVGQTVTSGIISALGRTGLGINTFENFIQTDAAINPGNSGGALINVRGELVGINTAIFSETGGSQGIGFAIPINLARDVTTQIIEKGHVVRGWLGVGIQNISPELAESFELPEPQGAIITHIMPSSPAEQAKLKQGDIITQINGQRVHDFRDTLAHISRQKPGSDITVTVLREGKTLEKKTKVSERPQQEANIRRHR